MSRHLAPDGGENFNFRIEWFHCTAYRYRVSDQYPDGIALDVATPDRNHFFTFDYNLDTDEIQEWAARQIRNLLQECDVRVHEFAGQMGEKIRPTITTGDYGDEFRWTNATE